MEGSRLAGRIRRLRQRNLCFMNKKIDRADSARPIVDGKDHEAPSVFRPEAGKRDARGNCRLSPSPKSACSIRTAMSSATSNGLVRAASMKDGPAITPNSSPSICAVGAPFAVLVAEQLFASGCRLLISVTSLARLRRSDPPRTSCSSTAHSAMRGRAITICGVQTSLMRPMCRFSRVSNRQDARCQASRYIKARRGRRMYPIARRNRRSSGRASWVFSPWRWERQPSMLSARQVGVPSSALRM